MLIRVSAVYNKRTKKHNYTRDTVPSPSVMESYDSRHRRWREEAEEEEENAIVQLISDSFHVVLIEWMSWVELSWLLTIGIGIVFITSVLTSMIEFDK